jgi:hypothetical protein
MANIDVDALRDDPWERLRDLVPGGREGHPVASRHEPAVKQVVQASHLLTAAVMLGMAAAQAIGTAPQYRSVLVATWPTRKRPVEQEQVVVGDLIYATSPGAGRWMKLPITASDRARLAEGLVRYPPHHCEAAGQVVESPSMQLYTYQQDVSGPGSAVSRFWVGKQDGRPQRVGGQESTTQVVITLEYEGVKPPDLHEPAPLGDH